MFHVSHWSVPGCIWSSQSGQPIDPVFDQRVLGDRLKLWHVIEQATEHHHLFPDEETANKYAQKMECKVYPHTIRLEADRVARIARFVKRKADLEESYQAQHPAMLAAYGIKPGPAKQFPHRMEIRIGDTEQELLEKITTTTGEDRSEAIRRLIREAAAV